MTCIVALEHEGGVVIGADSCVTRGNNEDCASSVAAKITARGRYLFASCGSVRKGQILDFGTVNGKGPPKISKKLDESGTFSAIVTKLVPWLRELMREDDGETKDGRVVGVEFLVCANGMVFRVASDFSVTRSARSYRATGCGEDFALGALHALDGYDEEPRDVVTAALAAAAEHVRGVSEPWTIREQPRP